MRLRIGFASIMVVVYVIGVFLGSFAFATQQGPGGDEGSSKFSFGINDEDDEDQTQVWRKDINVGGTDKDREEGFLDVVKSVVNWVLGLLGLIALIMSLYGGFMMLTARDNEEAYNKGRTIVKNALIGLVIIGIAWFIISLVFWLIVIAGTDAGDANTQVE